VIARVKLGRREEYTQPSGFVCPMGAPAVLVVGETPSLGRSVVDLLETAGVPTHFVYDLGAEPSPSKVSERYPVVIAVCNEPYCATGRRWMRGELPGAVLVVIGSRDRSIQAITGIRIVPLPLDPGPFLELIDGLLAAARAVDGAHGAPRRGTATGVAPK
jgi:hypothetical protein